MAITEGAFYPRQLLVRDGLYVLALSIGGAFSAFVFNLVLRRVERNADRFDSTTLIFKELVDEIETAAVQYWISRAKPDDAILELRLKSKIFLLNVFIGVFEKSVVKKRKHKGLVEQLKKFTDLVFDEATGGDFESAVREASPSTANSVSNLCAKMKADLVGARY